MKFFSKRPISYSVLTVVVFALFVISAVAAVYFYSESQNLSGVPKTTTTVTSIIKEAGGVNSSANYTSLGFSPQFVYTLTNRSVVTIEGSLVINNGYGPQIIQVLGTGFVANYSGRDYIVTNYHVVAGVSNLTVSFSNGFGYSATVIGSDPYADLAVLKVPAAPPSQLVSLNMTYSSSLSVGEPVIAVGNPFGLAGSMTFGIISQIGQTIQENIAGNNSIPDAIQFTAPISPSNSGGPLLDGNGNVVGITTAAVSNSQGVGFAIPSDTILRELPLLVTTGSYNLHPLLGIQGFSMNYQLAQAAGTNYTYGVLIESVLPGSPAANAGLIGGNTTVTVNGQPYLIGGDIIVSINGTSILNTNALSAFLEQYTLPGQSIQLGAVRAGTLLNFTVTIGARPPPSI
jgi:S1-C subfamily serine protease